MAAGEDTKKEKERSMRYTWTILEIMGHCFYQSFRHPRTKITQVANPQPIEVSPVPWWGSGVFIIVGITTWCFAAHWQISGLDEAARAMVYIPLGNIFGMSLSITGYVTKSKREV